MEIIFTRGWLLLFLVATTHGGPSEDDDQATEILSGGQAVLMRRHGASTAEELMENQADDFQAELDAAKAKGARDAQEVLKDTSDTAPTQEEDALERLKKAQQEAAREIAKMPHAEPDGRPAVGSLVEVPSDSGDPLEELRRSEAEVGATVAAMQQADAGGDEDGSSLVELTGTDSVEAWLNSNDPPLSIPRVQPAYEANLDDVERLVAEAAAKANKVPHRPKPPTPPPLSDDQLRQRAHQRMQMVDMLNPAPAPPPSPLALWDQMRREAKDALRLNNIVNITPHVGLPEVPAWRPHPKKVGRRAEGASSSRFSSASLAEAKSTHESSDAIEGRREEAPQEHLDAASAEISQAERELNEAVAPHSPTAAERLLELMGRGTSPASNY